MIALVAFSLAMAPPAYLGGDERWAAFALADGRCEARGRAWRVLPDSQRERQPMMRFTFASGRAPLLHVNLRRAVREGQSVQLQIDDTPFVLSGEGYGAWADAAQTRAIIAALRTGARMRVTARSRSGARFTDYYPLGGVPAAIDAAAAGCTGARAR
ncbi:invasion associated locus B family protein [Sphingomicrobium sp. XHP0239]|uniref:invasion associated locus B family protein n=1 Tax=Sphingomicrobium maritimum TaxID=3133972 RepID=UPI0031CC561C